MRSVYATSRRETESRLAHSNPPRQLGLAHPLVPAAKSDRSEGRSPAPAASDPPPESQPLPDNTPSSNLSDREGWYRSNACGSGRYSSKCHPERSRRTPCCSRQHERKKALSPNLGTEESLDISIPRSIDRGPATTLASPRERQLR